jgi:hypothetical protein
MTVTPEPMFISPADLADLAGNGAAAQAKWLKANSIPFIVGGDRALKVLRQTVVDKIMAEPLLALDVVSRAGESEDAADKADKIFESKLAEIVGTTSRALEHKRLAGIIPEGVWIKVGGRIMYSIKRYDDWMESRWVELAPDCPISQPKRGRKPVNKPVYKLV